MISDIENSPFKRSCSHLACPDASKVRLFRGKPVLPDIQYYFADDQIIPSDADVLILPEGGWAQAYHGNPFHTQRPLGHIVSPRYEQYRMRIVPNLAYIKSVKRACIIDLTSDSE
jgi:hypothetical protein